MAQGFHSFGDAPDATSGFPATLSVQAGGYASIVQVVAESTATNGYAAQLEATGSGPQRLSFLDETGARIEATDMEFVIKFKRTWLDRMDVAVALRALPDGENQVGSTLTYGIGTAEFDLRLDRRSAGSYSSLGSTKDIAPQNTWCYFKVRTNGGLVEATVWEETEAVPASSSIASAFSVDAADGVGVNLEIYNDRDSGIIIDSFGWGTNGDAAPMGPVDTGPTTLELQGAVTASSTTAGALSLGSTLSGMISAASTTSGRLGLDSYLSGQVNGHSSTSGVLGLEQALQGTIAASSSLSSELGLLKDMLPSGSVQARSTVTGKLSLDQGLAGTVQVSSAAAGTLWLNLMLSGQVTAASQLEGILSGASVTKAGYLILSEVQIRPAMNSAVELREALNARFDLKESLSSSVTINPLH